MAVFKKRAWTADQAGNTYYGDAEGDVYHVGLYIGNGKVVEAKGTNYGVVESCISAWHMAARLKNTVYDTDTASSSGASASTVGFPKTGIVKTQSTYLRVRSAPATGGKIGQVQKGAI